MGDWLSGIIDSLTGGAKDFMAGVGQALTWVAGDSSPAGFSVSPSETSSAADLTSPADAARLGADGGMFGLPTAESAGGVSALAGASSAKDGVWTAAGLKSMLSDLNAWSEKNPKTMVALGSAAAALLKRNESNMTNEILRTHYSSMDATNAGRLAMEQAKQANALTSGANLNVNGLPAVQPNGLITSNVDIPGGYNARRQRNTNYGAPA